MAFKHTQSRSFLRLTRDLENLGIAVSTSASREHIAYQLSFARDQATLQQALKALVETLVTPRLAHWEVQEDALPVMEARLAEHQTSSQGVLEDAFHAAVFGGPFTTMGRSVFVKNPSSLSVEQLKTFLFGSLSTDLITLVGCGVSHDELAAAAQHNEVALNTVEFSGSLAEGQGQPDLDQSPVVRVGAAQDDGLVHLALGARMPDAQALGGQLGSLLAANLLSLRLKHSESDPSKTSSGFSSSYSDAAIVGCQASAASADLEGSVKAMHAALSGKATKEELTAAVNVTKMQALSNTQAPSTAAHFLAGLSAEERELVTNNVAGLGKHLEGCAKKVTDALASGLDLKIATVGEQSTTVTTAWLK